MIRVDIGVCGAGAEDSGRVGLGFLFFLPLMVTFSKRMESRGKTEGERGVLSEKICRELCKEGSENDGASVGLHGEDTKAGEVETSGGKSVELNNGRIGQDSCSTGWKVETP